MGRRMAKSEDNAIYWYKKAVDAKYGPLYHTLDQINDLRGDYEAAFKFFKEGAILGEDGAQCLLAYCYEYGKGIPPSLEKSLYWNKEVAKQGNATAMFNYARNLLNIKGPDFDFDLV